MRPRTLTCSSTVVLHFVFLFRAGGSSQHVISADSEGRPRPRPRPFQHRTTCIKMSSTAKSDEELLQVWVLEFQPTGHQTHRHASEKTLARVCHHERLVSREHRIRYMTRLLVGRTFRLQPFQRHQFRQRQQLAQRQQHGHVRQLALPRRNRCHLVRRG